MQNREINHFDREPELSKVGQEEQEEQEDKEAQHLLEAFKYGVPPHGGIALGIDRLLMVIMGKNNIRELIAFPKDKNAKDPVMDAPSKVTKGQLDEVGLKLK